MNASDILSLAVNETTTISAGPPSQEHTLEKAAQSIKVLLVFFAIVFAVLCLLCVSLIVHVRYNRAAAFKGDDVAARKIILPAFEPLLFVLGVFNFGFMVFMSITLGTGFYDKFVPPIVLETLYSAHQFEVMLIMVFMLQKSVSVPALHRAIAIALVISVYTIPYIWWVSHYAKPEKQLVFMRWLQGLRAIVLVLSVYVFLWPPSRASKRTLRELAIYNIVRYLFTTVYMLMVMNPSTREQGQYALYVTLTWVAFTPLVIWRVLKADTDYWRGMGQRACALQDLFKQKNHMHEGVSSDGLHVLIEMHRKYIIDFAYLDLRTQIGVGTTSTVFQGVLRSRFRVAVKVYQPNSFNEDVIAGFSHEAALCGLLHHPNIVKFHGMCVSPPTICLVFELCQGSLEDVMRVHTRRHYPPARQQLLISVGYMLDAARAVAYLHSFSPPFIHRDIKPLNFLVDAECNVKLSDFGESRTLTKLDEVQNRQQQAQPDTNDRDSVVRAGNAWTAMTRIPNAPKSPATETMDDALESPCSSSLQSPSDQAFRGTQWSASMTVKGTADYMAPEVIRGKGGLACYDQATDVYSLAITMWDILNSGADKFAAPNASHLYVFERVLRGARPALDPNLPTALRDVIQRAWQGEPRLRPTAQEIVWVLQEVQESLCTALIVDVMDELQLCASRHGGRGEASINSSSISAAAAGAVFSGAAVSDALVDRNFVSSLVEAARMGNAWMDAGMLHHVRHAHAFESSSAALYYFDVENNDTLHQTMLAASATTPNGGDDGSTSNNSSNIPILMAPPPPQNPRRGRRRVVSQNSSSVRSAAHALDTCACRRLAQRLMDERTVSSTWRSKFHWRAGGSGMHQQTLLLLLAAKQQKTAVADDLVLTTALLVMDDSEDDDVFGTFTAHVREGSGAVGRPGRGSRAIHL